MTHNPGQVLRGRAGTPIQRIEITAGQDEHGSVVVVQDANHHLHLGHMFLSNMYGAAVADDGYISVVINPQGGHNLHTTWVTAGGGDALTYIYKNPTLSSNGTELLQMVLNQPISTTPPAKLYHTPTITNVGVALLPFPLFLPGGNAGIAVGNVIRQDTEFVFDKNTVYMIRVQNIAGNAQPLSIIVQYYYELESSV